MRLFGLSKNGSLLVEWPLKVCPAGTWDESLIPAHSTNPSILMSHHLFCLRQQRSRQDLILPSRSALVTSLATTSSHLLDSTNKNRRRPRQGYHTSLRQKSSRGFKRPLRTSASRPSPALSVGGRVYGEVRWQVPSQGKRATIGLQ